jgi:hypothetical protein
MKEECKSCVGCKYLYQYGGGYSNYTWEEDFVCCAKGRNANLEAEAEAPCDWNNRSPNVDNWPMTNNSRCELYQDGPYVTLDVDGDDGPADHTEDVEVIKLICEQTGRAPLGR